MRKTIQKKLEDSSHRKIIISLGLLCLVMVLLISMRIYDAVVLRLRTNAQILPLVSTVTALPAPKYEDFVLPGSISAWHTAPIYARTNGYVKRWLVDIGYIVKKGDLLAEIETPELDAQLRQAEADLTMLIAKNKLAQTTAARWRLLRKSDSVSQQETDEKVDLAEASEASVLAARANRDRLRELVSFERVVAPFDGIISLRATDIGALINAGSSPDEQFPLFQLVRINPLRVYVKIPQTYVASIKPDMVVNLELAEHPGERFEAKLLKTAHSIDPLTRTLLAQFVVENAKGELLPGGYTSVHFAMPVSSQTIRLPVNTLLFRKEGLQVATLNDNNRVVLKSIHIDRDFGNTVEINSGINPGEQIIINPSDSITNNDQVRVQRVQG